MKTTVEDISTTMKKVIVEIDEGRVAKKLDEAFASLSREAKIPGFRPGKAPRSLLETRYGPQVREDVSRNLVGETLPAAIEEAGFKPLGYPEIEKDTPAKGKPFKYTAPAGGYRRSGLQTARISRNRKGHARKGEAFQVHRVDGSPTIL